MTGKRFRLGYVCGDYGLIDNAQSKGNQWFDLHSMSENSEKNVQICINKMNELAEENEQLEIEIADLKYENKNLKINLNACKRGRKQLADENKQLKSENNMLKHTIGRNEAYIKKLTETSEWHC